MNATELKATLAELREMRFVHVSDEGLHAYVRIFSSIHNMIFTNAADGEFGSRTQYRERLDSLLRMLLRRYPNRHSVAQRARMLDTMYCILYNTGFAVDRSKEMRLYRMTDRLIEESLAGNCAGEERPEELFGIMRLILTMLHGIVEEAPHPWLSFVREKLASWARTLDAQGRWPGISEEEALQRIMLMNVYADMLLDARYDDAIRASGTNYCLGGQLQLRRMDILSHDDMRRYALLYETIRQGAIGLTENRRCRQRIAALLERQLAWLPLKGDDTLLCLSLAIDDCCIRISEELQHRLRTDIRRC